MAKKDKQIEGQLDIFDFCTRPDYEVVQANRVISGKQALGINSAKLLRSAIMQIKPEDTKLKDYVVSLADLAKMFGVSRQDLNQNVETMVDDILKKPLMLKEENGNNVKWVKYPWVAYCAYDSEKGLTIRLNDCLKSLLLQLKEHYTQYRLEDILTMRSVYSIRIFELIQARIYEKTIPKKGVDVTLTVDEIRQACDIVDRYKAYSSFKNKVVLVALKEIHEKTFYDVTYLELYEKKKIVAYTFHVTTNYMKNLT